MIYRSRAPLTSTWSCKILPIHRINRVFCFMQSPISKAKMKVKKAVVRLKAVSMPCILIAAPWCPHFIYSIITQRYNCVRKYWNIYFLCVSFLLCELLKWGTLWNSQSEQSSTLLFITLPNKAITDSFILGRNTRVLNGHVKPFLEIFLPLPKPYTFYVDIREQFKILYQYIL